MVDNDIPQGIDMEQVLERWTVARALARMLDAAVCAFLADRQNPDALEGLKVAHRAYLRATVPTDAA